MYDDSGDLSGWQPTVMNFKKRELLKDLLPVLSSNRALQRTLKEYVVGLELVSTPKSESSTSPIATPEV